MFRLSLRDELDRHVTRPLANSCGPPQSARTVALERRPLVYVCLADLEIVGDEVVVVLRVGNGGVQKLQNILRGRARRMHEHGTRLIDILAANVVDHETRLPRRMTHVLGARADREIGVCVAARLASAARRSGGGSATTAAARSRLRFGGLVLGLGLAGGLRSLGFGLLGGSLVLGLIGLPPRRARGAPRPWALR